MSEGFGPGFADAIKDFDDYENLRGDPAFEKVVEKIRRRASNI